MVAMAIDYTTWFNVFIGCLLGSLVTIYFIPKIENKINDKLDDDIDLTVEEAREIFDESVEIKTAEYIEQIKDKIFNDDIDDINGNVSISLYDVKTERIAKLVKDYFENQGYEVELESTGSNTFCVEVYIYKNNKKDK